MLKNLCRLEHVVEGKLYHLVCDQDSPVSHVKEALRNFMDYLDQVEAAAMQQASSMNSDNPVEEVAEEQKAE